MFLSASFTRKYQLDIVLTQEKAFSIGLILKPTEKAWVFLKSDTREFQNSHPFERAACFYVTISGNFENFQYFNFEKKFLKNETFSKKLEYHFPVESTKFENATFPYKTALSEANVKTNRMGCTEWT